MSSQLLKDPGVAGPGFRFNTEAVTGGTAAFSPKRPSGVPADTAWDIVQWGQDDILDPGNFSTFAPSSWDGALQTAANYTWMNASGNERVDAYRTPYGWVYGLEESAGPGTSTSEHDLFLSTSTLGAGIPLSSQVDLSLQARVTQASLQAYPGGGGIYASAYASFTANYSAPGKVPVSLFLQIPITSSDGVNPGIGYDDLTGDANGMVAIVNYLPPGLETLPFSRSESFRQIDYDVNAGVEAAARDLAAATTDGNDLLDLSHWTLSGSYIGWTAQDGGFLNPGTGGTSSEELELAHVVLSSSSASDLATIAAASPSAIPGSPVLAPALTAQQDDVRTTAGTRISFALPSGSFSDPDKGVLTYSASGRDGSPLPSWLSFDASSGTFAGTTPAASTDTAVLVTASSSEGMASAEAFHVYSAAASPTLAMQESDIRAAGNHAFSFGLADGSFSDPSGGTVSYRAQGENGTPLPSWLGFDPSTDTFSGTTPASVAQGVVVVATTSEGASSAEEFHIYATASTPLLRTQASDQRPVAGSHATFALPAGSFFDPDGGTVSYSVTGADGSTLPAWLRFDASTGTFDAAVPAVASIAAVEVVATTSGGGIAAEAFHIYGTPAAPTLEHQAPDQRMPSGSSFRFALPTDSFSAAEGTLPATIARSTDLSALPSWLTYDPASSVFAGTTPGGSGSYGVRVDASVPGGQSGAEAFRIYWGEAAGR